LNNIISILNKGIKFVPILNMSQINIFEHFLIHFNDQIVNLNKKIFIVKDFLRRTENTTLVISDNIQDKNFEENVYHDFFKKSQNKNDFINFNVNEEVLDFQLNVYKKLSKLSIEIKNNLTMDEFFALKEYIRFKPFKIVETDKNTGIAILSHELYDSLMSKNLNNDKVYEKIDNKDIKMINIELKSKIDFLLQNNHISQRLATNVLLNNDLTRFGKIRFMPKLHKQKFGERYIINCNMHPTSNIALLIDCILNPLVKQTESYIQDSQHLLQKVNKKYFPRNSKIYSCDFESLYTNIQLDKALDYVCDFVKDKMKFEHVKTIDGFRTLLEIIFNYNYFTYNNQVYKQKFGIAMGAICAPSIANIFVYYLEKIFLETYKPLFYARFIDDIFLIVNEEFNIDILINSFENLVLNVVSEKTINFLNLKISLCRLTGILLFSVYYKPTNVYSYLLYSSNHPKTIFKNIPYGLFLTIRRICSSFSDYLYFSRKIYFYLLKRGYDGIFLQKVSNSVSKLNRDNLIPYKNKISNFTIKNSFLFKLPFEKNLNNDHLNLNLLFKENILNSKICNYNLKILYSKQYSNRDIFINSFKEKHLNCKFYKCNNNKCLTCFFVEKCNVKMLDNFPLTMKTDSNCKSSCIYLISCKKCTNNFYIGQTGCLKDRFYNHIRDITKFRRFTHCTSVSIHFNLKDHVFFKDLSIFVIKSFTYNNHERNYQKELKIRFGNENYFLNIFKRLEMNLMNNDYYNLSNLKYYKLEEIFK
jgi:hypothetical protein